MYQDISRKGKDGRNLFAPWVTISGDGTIIIISADIFNGARWRKKESFLKQLELILDTLSNARVESRPKAPQKGTSGLLALLPPDLKKEYEECKSDAEIYYFLKKHENRITITKAGKKFIKDYQGRK